MAGTRPPAYLPDAFDRRRWLAVAVLVVCAELVVLTLAIGPYPHEKGQRLLLALVLCGPFMV